MEFSVSIKEIVRREKAFLVLLTTIFIGMLFASYFFKYNININNCLFIGILFCLFYFLTFLFFISISKIKLRVDDKKIEKINDKNIQIIKFSEISKIKVKRRTNRIIREIYIKLINNKNIILTAFEEDFENIFSILKKKSNTSISIVEVKEYINFDHFLFYPILGLLIGFLSIGFFKLITTTSFSNIKIILQIFSIYLLILSIYFIIEKPISAREARNNSQIADYLMAIILFCSSIFMICILIRG
ncbi:MAG: hypothetical protein PHR47_00955 [Candidatus Pacebacteria bacterium]|nr:hypothetical protein [Candidatus Paceibacterota bacterium]